MGVSSLRIVVMAGGRATRMNGVEKALLRLRGKPLIEYVLDAAGELGGELYIAPSKHTPLTKRWCIERGVRIIETIGEGYSRDLRYVASRVDRPILLLPVDTPFLTAELLNKFLTEAWRRRESLITLIADRSSFPKELQRSPLKAPVGISLLKGEDWSWSDVVMDRFPELLDIDTWPELRFSEALLK